MLEDQVATAEQVVEEPTGEEQKPKAKPKDPLAEYKSKTDKRLSVMEKAVRDAVRERDEIGAQLSETQLTLKYLRDEGKVDEDVEERVKRLVGKERELEKRAQDARKYERRLTIQLFTNQGAPEDIFEGLDDPIRMENAFLKWQMAHPDVSEETRADETPTPKKKVPETSSSGFDLGDGVVATKTIPDMTDEEFKKLSARLDAKARANILRRGR